MGVYAVKPLFRARLRGLEGGLIELGASADQVTLAGLACGLGAAGAVLAGGTDARWLLAVPPLTLLRLACNALDGMIATDTGTARPLGQVLNELCDRISDAAILLAATAASGTPLLGAATTAMVLVASSLGIAAAAAGGSRQYGGIMGKADRMLLLALLPVAAAVLDVRPAVDAWLAIVLLGSAVTLVQRWRAIRRELPEAVCR